MPVNDTAVERWLQANGLVAEPHQIWTSDDGSIVLEPIEPGRRKRVRVTESFKVETHPTFDATAAARNRNAWQSKERARLAAEAMEAA